MTSAQTKLYWRQWSKVRKTLLELGEFSPAEADQERHEIHRRALGHDKSSKALTNRDLNVILDHFDSYLVLTGGPSQPLDRERRSLLYAIGQIGLPDPYITQIALDAAGTADWQTLPLPELRKLRFTLVTRAAAARRKAS
jgi:hypothetical protein